MSKLKLYRCENAACTLGTAGQPGLFTGGITAGHVHVLTGRPLEELKKGVDFGDGICPNCGKPGIEEEDGHKPNHPSPHDPHQASHDKIAARVADPADPLDADGAQAALEELVEGSAG